MYLEDDSIVDIPENRVKFFGTAGKMLLPGKDTVEAVVKEIPPSQVISTGGLRRKLSEQFQVEGTCPVTTKKALLAIANEAGTQVPFWRVINQNGGLISQFPGGVEQQAQRLQAEGLTIDVGGTAVKVKNFKAYLYVA